MRNTKKNVSPHRPESKIIKVDFTKYRDPNELNPLSAAKKVDIKMYDATSLAMIDWPKTPEAALVRQYFTPILEKGTSHYFTNIDADIRLLKCDDKVIPILIVHNDYSNSYVCSPYDHYISLGLESIEKLKNPLPKKLASLGLKTLGKILKAGEVNKIIYVNHWLLSTDLYPKNISYSDISAITRFLKTQFPSYAIAFRSINEGTAKELKKHLSHANYKFIAMRQIFLTNTSDEALFKTRIIKSDLRMWKDKDFEVVEHHQLTPKDYPRIHELYNIVALEHHSEHNPKLSLEFISLMIENGLLKVKALKKDGIIYGITGYIIRDGLFFCPFFGYDKNHPDKNKIYRLLSTMLLLEASKDGHCFHQSAGASFYKTIRRATSYIEYLAINTDNLSKRQRLAWKLLRTIMNSVGISFMRKL